MYYGICHYNPLIIIVKTLSYIIIIKSKRDHKKYILFVQTISYNNVQQQLPSPFLPLSISRAISKYITSRFCLVLADVS